MKALEAGFNRVKRLLDEGGDVSTGYEGNAVQPVFRKYNNV